MELVREVLPAEPPSIRAARRLVLTATEGWADDDLVDAALVVTSELATNATLHAQTGFTIVVLRDRAYLRIEVHDGSQRLPRRKRYSDESATGRGLPLVEALSTLAGADRTDAGKVVWAELGGGADVAPPGARSEADVRAPAAPTGSSSDPGEVRVAAETSSRPTARRRGALVPA